ncbi:hypothetical protein AGDE_05725 [Angomonas deanei]|uniref:Uncharacterized protein n=1 Tax=Angomonas deanei TaxID=59799 RepID=A0A7G2CIE8_9TRYP|nr:hypothetical protein AGDE_05725 [Angomonas deanei]CAD2219145.1 hypothetical protein, conserved [Angomonas deanei]|eukprot:EPY38206.1 hypothetical protein AGDE_05725 [Angomonas deanei]
MWERVGCFLPPKEVCQLDQVSRDIRQHLKESNTATHLMQRYWNARWSELIWPEELPEEKRRLHPTSLTRSEGKKSWKKMYIEEYPLWVQRTFQGAGINNNAASEVLLFERKELNEHKTANELKALELTEEEAKVKALGKTGAEVVAEGGGEAEGEVGRGRGGGKGPRRGKGRGGFAPKDPSKGFTREDYKGDSRAGNRRGKHKKGGISKHALYADDGCYDDY